VPTLMPILTCAEAVGAKAAVAPQAMASAASNASLRVCTMHLRDVRPNLGLDPRITARSFAYAFLPAIHSDRVRVAVQHALECGNEPDSH
jgi:hypothetical protein